MNRLLIVLILSTFLLSSCSVVTSTKKCLVSKSALIMGKTVVTIKSSEYQFIDICQNTPSCKSMRLLFRGNDLFLDVVSAKDESTISSFKFGKVEDDVFYNSEEDLPAMYKKFQNYEIDRNGLLIKQKLDTNILFYTKNESYFSYNEYCSSRDALLGAVAIGLTEYHIK